MSRRYVLIFSGGMDSATLLHSLLHKGHECHALTLNYGQRHAREIDAAVEFVAQMRQRFGERLMRAHRVVDLSNVAPLLSGSSQTDATVEVPHGHYAEKNMKLTVVPNRNMILLAVAGGWAVSRKADGVAYAAHAGDHAIYPDCTPAFAEAMNKAFGTCDWHEFSLVTPFIADHKGDIASLGAKLGTPYEHTWTCYEGQASPCGECGACRERAEAFRHAGLADPLTQRPA